MLKRIFISGYKCLVNFELSPGNINLLLGPNGGGKSTLLEVLRMIQAYILGLDDIKKLFDYATLTRGQNIPIQNFELEFAHPNGDFKYELEVDYYDPEHKPHVQFERLSSNGKLIIQCQENQVLFSPEQLTAEIRYPFTLPYSIISAYQPETESLGQFKELITHLLVVHPNPIASLMITESPKEERIPSRNMENFISWYRFLSQDQGFVHEVTLLLQEVLPGFKYFKFAEFGEKHRVLKAYFSVDNGHTTYEYSFNELSDGQRMLIFLYTLLQVLKSGRYMVCLDEPENFLALPEIQPWLIELFDLCSQGDAQAVLISHHPELINYLLASPVGYWFERPSNLHTRVKAITIRPEDGGLPVSELIARGWLHD